MNDKITSELENLSSRKLSPLFHIFVEICWSLIQLLIIILEFTYLKQGMTACLGMPCHLSSEYEFDNKKALTNPVHNMEYKSSFFNISYYFI